MQTTNLSREGEASWVGRKVEAGSLHCFCKPDCEAERTVTGMFIHSPLSLPLEGQLHEGRNFVLFTAIFPL